MILGPRRLAAAALLLYPGCATAVPVFVSLVQEGAGQPVEARLEASRGDGVSHVSRVLLVSGARVSFDLEDGGPWRIKMSAPGYWAPEVVTNAAPNLELSLKAWPAGEVRGEVGLPEREPDLTELTLGFVPALKAPAGTPSGYSTCGVQKGRFSCVVPGGTVDLKLRARGYISHFRWGVRVPAPGTVDMGRLRLRRGASIIGTVRFDSRQARWEKCRIALQPDIELHRPPTLARVNDRGFFSVEDLLPGRYVIEASHPGLTSDTREVTIVPDVEANLREPLVLADPRPFRVSISPPLDPAAKPWLVTIIEQGQPSRTLERSQATDQGTWVTEKLVHGRRYTVLISATAGTGWWAESLEGDPPESLRVEITRYRVSGFVRLGNSPLRATILFGGENAAVSMPVESDDSGAFDGEIPRLGTWRVSVSSSNPPVRSTLEVDIRKGADGEEGRVEIVLPATVIAGEVVDARGDPVPSAVVRAIREGGEVLTARTTTGNFRFEGVSTGSYVLSADASIDGEVAQSEPVKLSVEDSAEPSFQRLTIETKDRYTGRVVSARGVPIPGARVEEVLPPDSPWGSVFYATTTDLEGKFEISHRKDATRAGLAIRASGYALKIVEVVPIKDGVFDVVLDQNGGNLSIVFPPAKKAAAPATNRVLRLSHAGLLYWPKESNERFVTTEREGKKILTIHNLESGHYAVCAVSQSEAVLVAAGSARQEFCKGGFLPAFGEVSILLPSP